ncbi:MAG: hypothetical protein H6969_12370 [Gammaproteobacteria bacterium]|nr:hypothetical protein [Gammaproteobacteria bacterium]
MITLGLAFLALLDCLQAFRRFLAGSIIHHAHRLAVQIETLIALVMEDRQQITGPVGMVGQHPLQEGRVHRVTQPLDKVRIDVHLERDDPVVITGKRFGEALHQQPMQTAGFLFKDTHDGDLAMDAR